MNNVIKNVLENKNINEIYQYAINDLFKDGPVSITTLEILTYLNVFAPNFFNTKKEEVLEIMCLFYKNPHPTTLQGAIFNTYNKYIVDKYHQNYTPVQVNILNKIYDKKCFSFSAPTSTGKSYIFRKIITKSKKDVVIIVPSRALINEYYDRIHSIFYTDKTTNILTFVDYINTKYVKRSIFILTPERAKELFKFKNIFDIELFLFDEAQLSDENSIRALYFDSIVRRIQNSYPNSKFIFAHPFVANPESQLIKNKFDLNESDAFQYQQKNIGQIFYCYKEGQYYHFGLNKTIMGSQKIKSNSDPLMKAIDNRGSILIYTTKESIYNKNVFKLFEKYIKACKQIKDKEALKYIEKIKLFIGANDKGNGYHYSQMIDMLRRGIVIHHGSLPLQARLLLEHFTQARHCRICFATSTLEQGINMPFDVVYLNTFQASKPLSIKNLIGRAGRSTTSLNFDYGSVVINNNNMSAFRNIMLNYEQLNEVSQLDIKDPNQDQSYQEFKDAINNNTFSDEFNLTNIEVERLRSSEIDSIIVNILNSMFIDNQLIPIKTINEDIKYTLSLYDNFISLYSFYLNNRKLSDGEKNVLNNAIKILLWKVHGKNF
jgi:replicative superfamily II helicase